MQLSHKLGIWRPCTGTCLPDWACLTSAVRKGGAPSPCAERCMKPDPGCIVSQP